LPWICPDPGFAGLARSFLISGSPPVVVSGDEEPFAIIGAVAQFIGLSTLQQLENWLCLPVAMTPCSDDCEPTLAVKAVR
jgi:hypothetical protein